MMPLQIFFKSSQSEELEGEGVHRSLSADGQWNDHYCHDQYPSDDPYRPYLPTLAIAEEFHKLPDQYVKQMHVRAVALLPIYTLPEDLMTLRTRSTMSSFAKGTFDRSDRLLGHDFDYRRLGPPAEPNIIMPIMYKLIELEKDLLKLHDEEYQATGIEEYKVKIEEEFNNIFSRNAGRA
ncbi:MAG: hypothetical protein ACR2PT_22060 [Endozoicomonas sp.]